MTDNVSEAHELVRRREWAAAIQIYDPILCPSTSNFNTPKDRIISCLVGRSECYLELNEFESVASDCQRLLKMLSEGTSTTARIHRRLIHSLYKLKWYKEAETACNDWITVLCADHEIIRSIERYRTVIQIANGQQNNPRVSVQTRLDNEVTALDDKLELWACTTLASDSYSTITAVHMISDNNDPTVPTSVAATPILINQINTELVNNETINAPTATTAAAATSTTLSSSTITTTTGISAITSMATNATTVATATNSAAEDDASASESSSESPLQNKPIEIPFDQLTISSREDGLGPATTPPKATTIPHQKTVSSSPANTSTTNAVTSPSTVSSPRSDTPSSSANTTLVGNTSGSSAASSSSTSQLICSYCAITLNTRADLRAHCQTESHQNVIMSDEGMCFLCLLFHSPSGFRFLNAVTPPFNLLYISSKRIILVFCFCRARLEMETTTTWLHRRFIQPLRNIC